MSQHSTTSFNHYKKKKESNITLSTAKSKTHPWSRQDTCFHTGKLLINFYAKLLSVGVSMVCIMSNRLEWKYLETMRGSLIDFNDSNSAITREVIQKNFCIYLFHCMTQNYQTQCASTSIKMIISSQDLNKNLIYLFSCIILHFISPQQSNIRIRYIYIN